MIEIIGNTVILKRLQDSGVLMEVERHDITNKTMLAFITKIKRVEEVEATEACKGMFDQGYTAGKESVREKLVSRTQAFIKSLG